MDMITSEILRTERHCAPLAPLTQPAQVDVGHQGAIGKTPTQQALITRNGPPTKPAHAGVIAGRSFSQPCAINAPRAA
jgi:hypothetical protein